MVNRLQFFLQDEFIKRGYKSSFYCCEDWGWWIDLKIEQFNFGVCINFIEDGDTDILKYIPEHYVCSLSLDSGREWSWKKFRCVDTTNIFEKYFSDMEDILNSDTGIKIIEITKNFPE